MTSIVCSSLCGGSGASGVEYASECAAIGSIAAKIGCMAKTRCNRVRQGACDRGLRAGPTTGRARRDMVLVRRVFGDNFQVYGRAQGLAAKLRREGKDVARCTVARLMRAAGLQGVVRGKAARTTISEQAAPCPRDRINRRNRTPCGVLGLQWLPRSKRALRRWGWPPPATGLAGARLQNHRKRRGSGNSLKFPEIPCSSTANSLLSLLRNFAASD